MRRPSITVGVVNCNRAHYARALVLSLLATVSEPAAVQLVFVDNASIERESRSLIAELAALRDQHRLWDVEIVQRSARDPANEFAAGLNEIVERAAGDVVIPLQGDSQFVKRGWEADVCSTAVDRRVGCVVLDAQRRQTIAKSARRDFSEAAWLEPKRPSVAGAGDVAYSRRVAMLLYPWSTSNERHEGTGDSETEMLRRCALDPRTAELVTVSLKRPAMAAIFTDPRGTNARIRGDRLYGLYAPPSDSSGMYYRVRDVEDDAPSDALEDVAVPLGWSAPLDERGDWKKSPIRPETAATGDWIAVGELA